MPKISFNAASVAAGKTGHNPSTSVKALPGWYKKMLKFIGNKKIPNGSGFLPLTVKACPPFLDAMISGYIIYTEYDIFVTQKEEGPWLEWRAGGDLIGLHGKDQIVNEQVPDGYSDQPFKFNNLWQIKTPRGYSTLFTHPQNRVDLPFFTISGIVETDTYNNVINFPFLIKKDFEGEIPAGTPIVQLFPFKRESWKMQLGEAKQDKVRDSQLLLNHKLVGGYKTYWWQRKNYS